MCGSAPVQVPRPGQRVRFVRTRAVATAAHSCTPQLHVATRSRSRRPIYKCCGFVLKPEGRVQVPVKLAPRGAWMKVRPAYASVQAEPCSGTNCDPPRTVSRQPCTRNHARHRLGGARRVASRPGHPAPCATPALFKQLVRMSRRYSSRLAYGSGRPRRMLRCTPRPLQTDDRRAARGNSTQAWRVTHGKIHICYNCGHSC